MPFKGILRWLRPAAAPILGGEDLPAIGPLPATFSDDVFQERWALRVIISDDGAGGLSVDFGESDESTTHSLGPWLPQDDLRHATCLALAGVLGRASDGALAGRVHVNVGVPGPRLSRIEPDLRCLLLARTHDVVLGALQRVWPQRVGAGSESLGALVALERSGDSLLDIIPGGEGATPSRAGASAWLSPLFSAAPAPGDTPWVEIRTQPREGSGGTGARNGGDGVVRRYRALASLRAHIRVDRVDNPPHGIDRAGPPRGSRVHVENPDGQQRPAPAWGFVELQAGETLVIHTCGGAGHGFPGYGDIEFDPGDWFGSSS